MSFSDDCILAKKPLVADINFQALRQQYDAVRKQTLALVQPLSDEDMVAQSMPDASPIKWHLAHTTWFFETFILSVYQPDFCWFNETFCHLFNSYYESVGTRHARPQRGLLTRPALRDVLSYREHVDRQLEHLVATYNGADQERIAFLVTVGLHHEMQHQELMSTDILHLFWHNPTFPAVHPLPIKAAPTSTSGSDSELRLNGVTEFAGGLVSVGADAIAAQTSRGFAYDCETPVHQTYLQPFAINNQLVTNGQWLEFMADGGYSNSLLWLSDGWHYAQKNHWDAPLYWLQRDGQYYQFGLDGLQSISLQAPVCHVSYYEADAFARWAGKRLPKEHEWELAAQAAPKIGNFLEQGNYRPTPVVGAGLAQMFGDVWEWTQSPFSAYPGFHAEQGALGEYNGKFMNGQYVLRGGSCVTPQAQLRNTYRNFFYPHHRWQFSGVRLASDLSQ